MAIKLDWTGWGGSYLEISGSSSMSHSLTVSSHWQDFHHYYGRRFAKRKAATHFSWRQPPLSTTCSSIVTSGRPHFANNSRMWSFHNVYGHSTKTRQLGGLLDSKGYGIALPKGSDIIYWQITFYSKMGNLLKNENIIEQTRHTLVPSLPGCWSFRSRAPWKSWKRSGE